MLKVIVDRERWYRGNGDYHSALLVDAEQSGAATADDRKMCCLGFACLAAGLSKGEILGIQTPSELRLRTTIPAALRELLHSGGYGNSACCTELMVANDKVYGEDTCEKPLITEAAFEQEREAKIMELGKQVGLDFEFVN